MSVVRLTPGDAAELQALRREALLLHPTAFSADPDVESELTLDDWRERLKPGVWAWFGGRIEGKLLGMCAFRTETTKKTRHTGYVGSMYVREAARGTGLAGELMEAVLAHARTHVEQLTLAVEAGNIRARKLYERHGFREVGRTPRVILVDGRYYDELQMYRALVGSE